MNQKLINEVKKYVEEHIGSFHQQLISKIENMKLNADFEKSYAKVINKFTKEFLDTFCFADGSIHWEELVKFNSEKD